MVDPKPNNELKETKNKDDLAPLDKQIVDQIQKSEMPKETKDEIIAHLEMYRGPIPHPDILEGYQKLYPNAAKEIIDNGVDESKHRRKLETARQKGEVY